MERETPGQRPRPNYGHPQDEHSWRFNRRSVHVLHRMNEATAAMDGRSLTYRELTGSRG